MKWEKYEDPPCHKCRRVEELWKWLAERISEAESLRKEWEER